MKAWWRGWIAEGVFVASLALAACAPRPAVQEAGPLAWPPPPEPPRYYHERTILSSTDVQESTTVERWRYIATGETTRGRGMDKPFGVIAANGRVFVGDTVGRKVSVYDLQGKRYFEFGERGAGSLAKPLGMATDQRNRIYIIDGTAKRVAVYDHDGKFLKAIGSGDVLERPSGVAANADGSRIYVVDTGGVSTDLHRVRVFDQGGNHLFDFGKRGTEPGEFNLPHMATVGADGNVYVVDGGNFRIQKFTPDGKFLMSIGQVGRRVGQFSRPKGVAVDREGKIFVVDAAFGNFQIFNDAGQLLLFIGDRGEDGGPGKFMLPAGISVDNDGRVYVVDQFFRKLEVFRPDGVPERQPTANASARK